MSHRTIRNVTTSFAITLGATTIALAQSSTPQTPPTVAAVNWQIAQSAGSSKRNLLVVTVDHPQRWHPCHVQSFTVDKLVCARQIGGSRTYLPQQIAALILPGDNDLRVRLLLGFNGGLAAAIFSTVVLSAVCPPCAVATGLAALFFFGAASAVLIGDDQPNRLLYLAPGKEIPDKHRFIQTN